MQYLLNDARMLFVVLTLAVATVFVLMMALVYWAGGKVKVWRCHRRASRRRPLRAETMAARAEPGDGCPLPRECA